MAMVNDRDLLEVELVWAYLFLEKVSQKNPCIAHVDLCENFLNDMDKYLDSFLKQLGANFHSNFLLTKDEIDQSYQKIREYRSGFLGSLLYKSDIELEHIQISKNEKYIAENQNRFDQIDPYFFTSNFDEMYVEGQSGIKNINIANPSYDRCLTYLCAQNNNYATNKNIIKEYIKKVSVDSRRYNQFIIFGDKRAALINEHKKMKSLLINSLKIIPEYYCTYEAISTMLWYFINRRGDSIKELINLYEQEKWQNAMLRSSQNIANSINRMNYSINQKFADLACELRCARYDINKGIQLCSEKLDRSIDNNTKHYLKIADLINNVNKNNVQYNEQLVKLIQDKTFDNNYDITINVNRY